MRACVLSCFSYVWCLATPWTIVYQAPLCMGFSRLEYWSELPWHPPVDLPNPGIDLHLLCLLHGLFATTYVAMWIYSEICFVSLIHLFIFFFFTNFNSIILLFYSFLKIIKNFYWDIGDLQNCVGSVYSKVNQLYIYVCSLFSGFFFLVGRYRVLTRIPCALQ